MFSRIEKIWKWEFWPFWLFYIPIFVVYLWYSLRARSLLFFTAANPGISMGGFIDYSKYDILKKLPEHLIPLTIKLPGKSSAEDVLEVMTKDGMSFPVMLKPNKGQRGFGVEKIRDEKELRSYLSKFKYEIILQKFIDLPEEYGVMYYRFPGKRGGNISSLVKKEFIEVVGDGKSTLAMLVKKSKRGRYYVSLLSKRFAHEWNRVLNEGERKKLVDIGNHCKGATFIDASPHITPAMVECFDKISDKVEGFYFGRYDVKVSSPQGLESGKGLYIVELNGVNSEPAHIYDPKMPLFRAYRHMFRHWKVLFQISRMNHKRGVKYVPFKLALRTTRHHFRRRKMEMSV